MKFILNLLKLHKHLKQSVKYILSLLLITIVMSNGGQQNSELSAALSELGFNGRSLANGQKISASEEQEAFIATLFIAEHLHPQQLWNDFHAMGGIHNAEVLIKTIHQCLNQSVKKEGGINLSYLRNHFLLGMDKKDIIDWVVYTTQKAFNRQPGRERNELPDQLALTQRKAMYLQEVRNLGVIERILPQRKVYDATLIMGASRVGVLARIADYKFIVNRHDIQIDGPIYLLAGSRELWAEIDGILPEIYAKLIQVIKENKDIDSIEAVLLNERNDYIINEGKDYMQKLAHDTGIQLKEKTPFIRYTSKETIPIGRYPDRTYASYVCENGKKLTETLMAKNLIETFFPEILFKMIDTTHSEEQARPTTESTIQDFFALLVTSIKSGHLRGKKDIYILMQSNNPYVERQALVAQRTIEEMMEKENLSNINIHIDGVGFSCKQDPSRIQSELAALIVERYKTAIQKKVIVPKRDITDLLFQTRKVVADIPAMPSLTTD